jgi:cytochrome c-type biogenesis protein CcmH/NrfG
MRKIHGWNLPVKKEYAFLFIILAFFAGFGGGVVYTVYHEDQTSPPAKSPSVAPATATIPEETQKQIRSLQAILKNDPKNVKALIDLGNLFFDAEQVDPAIDAYSQALAIDPKNPDVLTDRGVMHRRKGEFDRAIADFKKAAEIDPRHVNSRYNLGVVLLHDKGDMKGAISAWEEYLKVDPQSPRAQNIRTQIDKMKSMAK